MGELEATDLGALFDRYVHAEFVDRDVDETMAPALPINPSQAGTCWAAGASAQKVGSIPNS